MEIIEEQTNSSQPFLYYNKRIETSFNTTRQRMHLRRGKFQKIEDVNHKVRKGKSHPHLLKTYFIQRNNTNNHRITYPLRGGKGKNIPILGVPPNLRISTT
jgi:hypothetical protein